MLAHVVPGASPVTKCIISGSITNVPYSSGSKIMSQRSAEAASTSITLIGLGSGRQSDAFIEVFDANS